MDIDQSKIPRPPVEAASEQARWSNLLQHYEKLIRRGGPCLQVLKELEKDPRVQALAGQMIITGTGAMGFHVNTLAKWYLWAVHEYGQEAAKTNLNSYLNSETVPIVDTLWVLGIEVEEGIHFDNGISIIPIKEMPNSLEKELYLRNDFGIASSFSKPKAAIRRLYNVQKIAGPPRSPSVASQMSKLRQSAQHLIDTALLLNALDDISCLPFFSTTYSLPEMPLGIFGSSIVGRGHNHDVYGKQFSRLPASKINIINDLINQFSALSFKNRTRMNRVLSRLSQAKRRSRIEDKILDLGIALEMVLLADNTNNDQLSLAFRLRGSWLIAENHESRREIFRQLKEIYTYRSQVAHTGELCRNDPQKKQKVTDNFPSYAHLAEKIIRRIIRQPNPNWTETILGST